MRRVVGHDLFEKRAQQRQDGAGQGHGQEPPGGDVGGPVHSQVDAAGADGERPRHRDRDGRDPG